MKTFRCDCGNYLYFENSQCLACGRMAGYLPDERKLSTLEPWAENIWLATSNRQSYRQCKNWLDYDVCNWMVLERDEHVLCVSCRLNQLIPNLAEPQNVTLWYRVEQAKRRLLYTLYNLNLPVVGRAQDPEGGLCFEFLQDINVRGEFDNTVTTNQSVVTGHHSGKITINLREADHSARIEMRDKMNERYRTLLGHFRHEAGHYYWNRLIEGTSRIDYFRELFGDERNNYQQALNDYYKFGPPSSWQEQWVSTYASSHPWEDWAETWAHYLHIVDTVETAHDFGFRIQGCDISLPQAGVQMGNDYSTSVVFDTLLDDWRRLSVALNALNRSMGLDDAYPFVISGVVLNKLRFIHQTVIQVNRQSLPAFIPSQNAVTG
ncbi:MAG: putative zinc-binding metallopeptidase [Burkholderiales bacterium]|nr:putative zinc-binding metallopeptidase [Burkholderiales bacterium]